MFGSPKMFCKFHAHKGHQEVFKDTCGHFQCVSVPWTREFVRQKKFSNQHLSGKKFSASCLDLQRCFVSFMPTKVLRRSQRTLVGNSNMFLCLLTCKFVPQKKFSNQNLSGKSSLSHVWIFKDVLPVSCIKRSSGGLIRHFWALSICYCALDM